MHHLAGMLLAECQIGFAQRIDQGLRSIDVLDRRQGEVGAALRRHLLRHVAKPLDDEGDAGGRIQGGVGRLWACQGMGLGAYVLAGGFGGGTETSSRW